MTLDELNEAEREERKLHARDGIPEDRLSELGTDYTGRVTGDSDPEKATTGA